jgi:hypothetical protein
MGEVRKFQEASKIIQFDFTKPDVYINQIFTWQCPKCGFREVDPSIPPEDIRARSVKLLIVSLLDAKYPQGAGRDEGQKAGAWFEVLNDPKAQTVSLPKGLVDWMREITADRKLAIIWRLAQWREALVDYFKTLEETPEEKTS